MTTRRHRVVFVAGWGRSGSTLLSRLLSVHDDIVFVGELRDLWHRGVDQDRPCGCGETFHTCPFWMAVGETAYGGWHTQDVRMMQALRDAADRPWTPLALARDLVPAHRRDAVDAYIAMLDRVIAAIDTVTGGRVILDSSKIPSFAWLLAATQRIDLRSIHLVRDPRGVIHSWRKSVADDRATGPGEQPSYMERYSPATAVARYDLYNFQAEHLDRIGPRLLLRYEDLVDKPAEHLAALTAFCGITTTVEDHVTTGTDGTQALLGPSHSVVGNPMRMTSGAIPLRTDAAWRTDLGAGTRRAVTLATLPLLRRYGYEVGA